jgi:hypothetical protein
LSALLFKSFQRYTEKSTITILKRIKGLVFVMEGQLVLCDVETEYLCVVQITFSLKSFKCCKNWINCDINIIKLKSFQHAQEVKDERLLSTALKYIKKPGRLTEKWRDS